MSDEQQEITILYEEPPGKSAVAVHGAHGGVMRQGTDKATVVAHVFSEYLKAPSECRIPADEAGHFREGSGAFSKQGDVVREIQATLMMSPRVAIELGNWLVGHGTKGLATDPQQQEGTG